MFERLDNPGLSGDSAAGLFVCCENECVLDYAVLAWRDRLAANGPDSVTRGLNQVLFRPHWRARAGDKIRAELASHNAGVRIGAADLLTHLGGLHDVALFLDLLSLPPTRDEDPAERDTLLRAAATLAGAEDVVSVSGTSAAGAAAGTGPTTRYDDWLLRRRRLTHLKPLQHPYVEEHRAVLDALLECCRNTEAGAKPARFPAPPQSFVSRRAVVVYHQLGRAEVRGNVTETDAGKHASSILQRIARLDPQSHARSYAASGVVRTGEEPAAAQGPAVVTEAQAEIWKELENEIAIRGFKSHANIVYRLIEDALNLGTRLPEKAVYYLAQHLYNPLAIELLGRCSNASVLEYMYGAWRERMSRRRRGPLRLVEFFVLPAWREKAAERFRRELAGGEDSRTRVLTARAVGRLGTLDDVGLLSDLMSLPRSANEDARERPALLAAMRRLARRVLDTLPASI
jgi:hypothetical protein